MTYILDISFGLNSLFGAVRRDLSAKVKKLLMVPELTANKELKMDEGKTNASRKDLWSYDWEAEGGVQPKLLFCGLT